MRKIIIFLILVMISFLYKASESRADVQIVEVSVCEESLVLAELLAKAKTSRKKLYSVSYCTCEGIDASYKTDQTIGSCEPPKNRVYLCNCIGRVNY